MITMDDKYRFEDFGFYCEPGNEDPLMPSFERKTLAIPGRLGSWDFGVEIGEKPFSYPLKVIERYHTQMQRYFNEFVAFLLDPFGKPREIKIVRDYEPDKHYMVKVSASILPERLEEEGAFILGFIASDPLKYGNVENHEINWDSETVTFDDSYSIDTVYVDGMLITSSQTVETTVNGYAMTPTILISGSGEDVVIEANGKSLSLGSFTNSEIVVNGKSFTIFKDGIEEFINGDIPDLLPGRNQVNISGSNLNFNLSLRVRDQYM
ncbi:phage tail family protein [Bacillus sp. BHET2]|uniref:phage tail domain-containing protein n=1 Tax=Bacillus sp. BHET2 TaxID=2583818 RepID=UPI00110D94BF|nr:phage tail domain-containing protein [Bacillus sp. BHET2]TMU85485.1 phage tail family protein [Bacillus sp. BHET2]